VLQVFRQVSAQVLPHVSPLHVLPVLHGKSVGAQSGVHETSVGAQQIFAVPVGVTCPPAIVLICSLVKFLSVTLLSFSLFFMTVLLSGLLIKSGPKLEFEKSGGWMSRIALDASQGAGVFTTLQLRCDLNKSRCWRPSRTCKPRAGV
jgi:hypothetical protein